MDLTLCNFTQFKEAICPMSRSTLDMDIRVLGVEEQMSRKPLLMGVSAGSQEALFSPTIVCEQLKDITAGDHEGPVPARDLGLVPVDG